MDPWHNDKLGFQAIGGAFTNFLKTIDSAQVVSIEAGFGRGKTFFRTAWAQELRNSGEVVVEVDAQQSDHSGDPMVTLLASMVEALPRDKADKGQQALQSAKKLGAIGARAVAKIALRSGADELIDAITDTAIDKLEDFDELDSVVAKLGDGMSKAAGQFIAAQMAAEKVRKKELPEQLDALHSALTQSSKSERVVIIIDELDRCHPDYTISVLEAMKLVFNRSGFVFFLMVNENYLERLAQHRFGGTATDEKYLDKFVDIRLRLKPKEEVFGAAVVDLAEKLPLSIPYADEESFSVGHAAKLASLLARRGNFSMRKVERTLLKVEMALRCYADRPLDPSLLVFLAFYEVSDVPLSTDLFARSTLTPEFGAKQLSLLEQAGRTDEVRRRRIRDMVSVIDEKMPEFRNLPRDRYRMPEDRDYYDWALVFEFLAPHYIPTHRDILDAVAEILS